MVSFPSLSFWLEQQTIFESRYQSLRNLPYIDVW